MDHESTSLSHPGVILANPASGAWRGGHSAALTDLAQQHGWRLVFSTRVGELTELAYHEVKSGCTRLLAAGGDDSVREVLWGLDSAGVFRLPLERRPEFGILPLGTFNNFARYLGVPLDLSQALTCALHGQLRYVDLGRVLGRGQGTIFTESVGVGLDVAAWKAFPKESPSLWRRLWDGAWAVVKALTVFRPRRYFLEIAGEVHSIRAYHLSVANCSMFSAGFTIAPHALIDDGRLDLCIIPSRSRLSLLLSVPIVFLGKHTAYLKDVRYQQVQRVRLWSHHRGQIRIDGKLGPRLPVEIEVMPQALPIRLPT